MPNEAKTEVRVYLEVGGKRTFASAAGWPGWCRPGKDQQAALAALAAYAPRYAVVASLAKVQFIKGEPSFKVVERIKGNATTDYGAPGAAAKDESKTLTPKQATRMRDLVQASWDYLDKVVATAPSSLRKGPRGGGRDRDAMFDHVLGAESEYAKRIGVRQKQPDAKDKSAVRALRKAILQGFHNPNREEKWPVAYAARRTAWHALDHAWEIEDRSSP